MKQVRCTGSGLLQSSVRVLCAWRSKKKACCGQAMDSMDTANCVAHLSSLPCAGLSRCPVSHIQ